jgi:lipoate-protein ligase B
VGLGARAVVTGGTDPTLRVRWLGRVEYDEGWDLQRAIWEGKTAGRTRDDYVLLLEHPHTYTVGRNGDGSNLKIPRSRLADMGATIRDVDRGGDITYHGPGQLVGYPIVDVPRLTSGFDAVGHVRRIEQVVIDTLGAFGIDAWTEEGYTGVWTRGGKVAAVGVRVARGVSMHGFAINVDPDMAYFGAIVPCGIADRPVTSMRSLLERRVSIEEVANALVPRLAALSDHDDLEWQFGAFARGTGDR